MTGQSTLRSTATEAAIVDVTLAERSYKIHIGSGLLANLGSLIKGECAGDRCALITNPTVARYYREPVVASLRQAGVRPEVIEIADGEAFKSLASLAGIFDGLIDAKLERGHAIVALGGGVVGDVAGFAAATYLRGVPLVQVPTTLLAQVDSSVGGKTAVNHSAGKNLIGTFYQPKLVVADLSTILTLPRREFVAGLAEVVKYGIILDPELFAFIETHLDSVLSQDHDALLYVVRRSCELKAQVVAKDEREEGLRAVLNFGHTLAHALESLTDYRLFLHGEAVAIGMAFATALSTSLGFCSETTQDRVMSLLQRLGLRLEMPEDLSGPALIRALTGDKKSKDGKVKFVCVSDLGSTRFEYLSSQQIAEYAARRPWGGV